VPRRNDVDSSTQDGMKPLTSPRSH